MYAAQEAARAVEDAVSIPSLDAIMKSIWEALGADKPLVTESEATRLCERIEEKRNELREKMGSAPRTVGRILQTIFTKIRRHQFSPDRAASIERRRRVAYSGPLPPHLGARFTIGQLAVLRVVGDALVAKGFCDLPVDAIAAKAGVCRRVAQMAMRLAESDGLILVTERRRRGLPNLTNVIRLAGGLGRDWEAWLKRGRRDATPPTVRSKSEAKAVAFGGVGCTEMPPTNNLYNSNNLVSSGTVVVLPRGSGRPGSERSRWNPGER